MHLICINFMIQKCPVDCDNFLRAVRLNNRDLVWRRSAAHAYLLKLRSTLEQSGKILQEGVSLVDGGHRRPKKPSYERKCPIVTETLFTMLIFWEKFLSGLLEQI